MVAADGAASADLSAVGPLNSASIPRFGVATATATNGFNTLMARTIGLRRRTAHIIRAPRRETALGYALLAPSLFGVVAFLLLPILVVAWLSLHRWDLLGPIEYVGAENWRAVLRDSA